MIKKQSELEYINKVVNGKACSYVGGPGHPYKFLWIYKKNKLQILWYNIRLYLLFKGDKKCQ